MEALARDAAVTASLAFQYGCPLAVLRAALTRDHDGGPATPLGAALDALGEVHHSTGSRAGSMKLVLGIDIGITGAIALLDGAEAALIAAAGLLRQGANP